MLLRLKMEHSQTGVTLPEGQPARSVTFNK